MKNVLFVDDQKEILDLLKVKLKNQKYNAYYASSGDEALEILNKMEIHVIVTDLLMPGKNGIALLQEIKEHYPQVVRIVLSGLSQVTSILSAINSGDIYRYITKPWKIDEQAESIINSALEYSDFLISQVEETDNYTLKDLQNILDSLNYEACLIGIDGTILFGKELKSQGMTVSLSNGSLLKLSPSES